MVALWQGFSSRRRWIIQMWQLGSGFLKRFLGHAQPVGWVDINPFIKKLVGGLEHLVWGNDG